VKEARQKGHKLYDSTFISNVWGRQIHRKTTQISDSQVMAGKGKLGVTANDYAISLWSNGNILELH